MMERVLATGMRIAYERAGGGPPIVLLHGILSDSRMWRRQLTALSDEFTVIAWDAPGCGLSADPPEAFSMTDYADCLATFIESLEVSRAHVVGLSWGGVLAQELYRRHASSIRSLVLAATYAGWKGSLPDDVCAARLQNCLRESYQPASAFVPGWIPGLLTAGAEPELVRDVITTMSAFHPVGYRAMAQAVADADERDVLPMIRVPTLILWGDADQRAPLAVGKHLRDQIPAAKMAVLEGAGHLSNVEFSEGFNAELRKFLSPL
jgi:pimeloyl-ACP methyl ester carboxylesterase